MQGGVVVLRQVHVQAYLFDGLIDEARQEGELFGDLFMDAHRREWKVWFINGLDLFQLFTVTFVGLQFPPAWNFLTVSHFLDNLFDSFLGDAQFFGYLCADAVELGGYSQFQVTCLDLGDLLRCWLERLRRWNLLTLGCSWGRWFGCLCWPCWFFETWAFMRSLRARFTWASWSARETWFYGLTWTLAKCARDVTYTIGGRAVPSGFAIATRTTGVTVVSWFTFITTVSRVSRAAIVWLL